MQDYMIRESELLHPEPLRQCSSLMPDYRIRGLELLYPEPLRQCSSVMQDYYITVRATISRASETVQQRDAGLHDNRIRATTSRS
jgi:hypothetical protein